MFICIEGEFSDDYTLKFYNSIKSDCKGYN